MPMRYSLRISERIQKRLGVAYEAHLVALKAGLKAAGDEVKEELREDLDVFESKVSYTWRGEVYPKKGLAKDPAYQIWSQIPNIVESHDLGVTITPVEGKYLWIPVKNGPMDYRRTKASDRKSFRKALAGFGRTRFIPARGGRSAMIVGETTATRGDVSAMARAIAPGKYPGRYAIADGPVTVPLFWLVPKVKMPKRLNASSIIRRAAKTTPRRAREAYRVALKAELANRSAAR